MNRVEIKEYLAEAKALGIRPGLERMRELMRRLGDPQDELAVIHVAGTNGKGSTSAYLASILSRVYKKVGWYSSPAVFDERETIRILVGTDVPDTSPDRFSSQISDSFLSEDAYESTMTEVIREAKAMTEEGFDPPTLYELETAGAFLAFKNEKTDIAIVEVGMGGREDATNILNRVLVSVITPIGLDHMQYLGGSIFQIAGEKAGIIKEKTPVVTCQPGLRFAGAEGTHAAKRQARIRSRIIGMLKSEAEDKNAEIFFLEENALRIEKQELAGTEFSYLGKSYHSRMLGSYQPKNAALAIDAILVLESERKSGIWSGGDTSWMKEISPETIGEGIAAATWPGRCEVVSEDPVTIYDGAHNTDGMVALTESLKALLPGRRLYGVMGVFMDKAVEEMVRIVMPSLTKVMTVKPPRPRGLASEALAEVIRRVDPWTDVIDGGEDVAGAVKKMQEKARADGAAVVVFGSLSLAEEVY